MSVSTSRKSGSSSGGDTNSTPSGSPRSCSAFTVPGCTTLGVRGVLGVALRVAPRAPGESLRAAPGSPDAARGVAAGTVGGDVLLAFAPPGPQRQPVANITVPVLESLKWVDEYDPSSVHLEVMTFLPDIENLHFGTSTFGHAFGPYLFHVLRMSSGIRKLVLKIHGDLKLHCYASTARMQRREGMARRCMRAGSVAHAVVGGSVAHAHAAARGQHGGHDAGVAQRVGSTASTTRARGMRRAARREGTAQGQRGGHGAGAARRAGTMRGGTAKLEGMARGHSFTVLTTQNYYDIALRDDIYLELD
ncbi:hypothetical protein PR202_ga28081 [Eleusine coracana subsp. coracana]|uniref:Uncharacterized protein n=1 Tax=Eleusine coracana subsp. coracana TaxID=191504 RepID=A0AAV5DHP2_ELECO|nr:hypothetical protein PR202_ga28081 [Eleusine coracana subsp. coracana]